MTTNVDHLLENFTINEILDIEKKLKNDIERKKEELKELIGERYSDLIEAADTIKEMNISVNNVLKSLNCLEKRQQTKQIINKSKTSYNQIIGLENSLNINEYKIGLIIKIIVDIPLEIWSSIQNNDILFATYNYFYGKHLCSVLRKSNFCNESSLLRQYESAINRFNEVIVKKCWNSIKKSSLIDNFDQSLNADTFCCLVLLQDLSPKQVFDKFLEKRKNDINECFVESNNDLKQCLQSFIDILFNTIKSIHSIFFNSSGIKFKTLLHQRYERISKVSYESPIISERVLTQSMKSGITEFKIMNKTSIDVIDSEIIKNETKIWINSIKDLTKPLLKNMLESIDSANYICTVLTQIDGLLKQSQKLVDWEEYCEELMAIYIPIWEEFIMEFIIIRITSIINEMINNSLNSLKDNIQMSIINNNNLNANDMEVINFIWDESETNSLSLSKKAFAQIPFINKFCSDFDDSLKFLLNDIKIIKDYSFQLIKKQSLDEIESKLVNACYQMVKELKDFLDSINGSTDSETVTLFCAQFLRQMTQSCPHLALCFESSSNLIEYSWPKAKDMLLSFSYNSYQKWFDRIISQLFTVINCDSLTTLNEFISNAFVWDKIQTSEESDDGKVVVSMIEVPLQISSFLHNNLSQLCSEANRVTGHTLPRTVALNILSSLTKQLVLIYGNAYDSLSNSEYPQNIKQTIALQMYFDLLFFKQFLGTTRDHNLKNDEMVKIQEMLQKFETFIDPFDLHVFFPYIQTNIAKIGRTSSVTFGLLLPDSSSIISDSKSKPNQQNNELHNILPFNCCQKPFTLLNVNSISNKTSKKHLIRP